MQSTSYQLQLDDCAKSMSLVSPYTQIPRLGSRQVSSMVAKSLCRTTTNGLMSTKQQNLLYEPMVLLLELVTLLGELPRKRVSCALLLLLSTLVTIPRHYWHACILTHMHLFLLLLLSWRHLQFACVVESNSQFSLQNGRHQSEGYAASVDFAPCTRKTPVSKEREILASNPQNHNKNIFLNF